MIYLRTVFMTLCIISISMVSTPFVYAQKPDVVVLDDLIQEAVENNPEIKAMHDAFQAAEQRIKQAISLPEDRKSVV